MNIRKDNTHLRPHRAGLGIKPLGAWIAALALAALVVSPPALYGAVIDDFDGDQPGWDGWNPPTAPSEPPALAELASKRLRISANFTTPTDPAHPVAHLCNVYYATDLPVRQDKSLELRTHLVSVNLANNLFSCLVTVDANGGEYVLMWSRTEVALLKWSQTDGFSVAFWETHSGAYIDVILALALTPEGDDLLIEAKVTRRVNGATVYQRTVSDTPGSDWGVPDPLPHGWQIFEPDPGPAYTGDVKIVGLGMLHDTDGQQGTAVVQFDNLEYRAGGPAILDIEKTVTISWPEETLDEMIVVGRDSIESSVWAPYPAPIARQFGQLCVAVPATKPIELFKLVPGTHFIDDFSEAKQPFATRRDYRLFWPDPGEHVTVGNGVMKVSCTGAATGGIAIVPPEDVVVGDFYTSVDILRITSNSTNWLGVSVYARGIYDGDPEHPTSGTGYFGGVGLNRGGILGDVRTVILGVTEEWGRSFSIEAKPPPYRLEFSCVGQSLRLRVLSLITKEIIAEQTHTGAALTQGVVGLFLRRPDNDPTTAEVILDNYFVTGTKP